MSGTPTESITARRGVAEGGYSYCLALLPDFQPRVTLASAVKLVVMHAATGRGWRCTTTLHQLAELLEDSGMVSPQAPHVLEWLMTAAKALKPTMLLSDTGEAMHAECSCKVGRAGLTASFRLPAEGALGEMTQQDALVAIAGLLEEVLVAEVQAEVFRLSHAPRLAAAVEVVPATAEEVAASPAKATAAAEASASASAAAPTAGASTPPAQPTPQTTPSQKRRRGQGTKIVRNE